MTPEIRLFSDDFSGMDTRLVKFLRNQPANRPAIDDAGRPAGNPPVGRCGAHRSYGYDTRAPEVRQGDCLR